MSHPVIIGNATLYQGDCLDVLRTLPDASVDAVVTDPPYSIAGGNSNGRTSRHDHQYWQHWFSAAWRDIERVATREAFALVFCDWRMIGALAFAIRGNHLSHSSYRQGWEVTQALVFDRMNIGMGSPYRNAFEMIAFARASSWRAPEKFPRNISTVVRHPWHYGKHAHHGAEKPVGLLEELMAPHDPSAVLDPFMGSGTCGVAAIQQGRKFIGIEIDPGHFDTACRRIEAAQRQASLLDPEPTPTREQEALAL